ncbi:family 16 glycoside hydrolase [Halalkalibaculum sp. DA3122]|uniref:family 16 glycoside hydrolase n=1 Tax=Halalkalibaculum sp. DA3122 TaxID=3373607 RepID=UPI00375495CA
MNTKKYAFSFLPWSALLLWMVLVTGVHAQDSNTVLLDDLSYFEDPAGSWQLAGGVTASLDEDNAISISGGEGILVNNPGDPHQGEDLYTRLQHGDIDLSLEYMMPRGSNSGIYLQGRYELQLHDSWTVKVPTAAHNGGIYQRPADAKGPRQGYAPRQNASRAPGLWQHLELSFQAPRFDENGRKIANARLLRAELNGVPIHENVELMGPTAGAYGDGEVPKGPLRFQGDHGPVAFRNVEITPYNRPAPSVGDLRYQLYEGVFTEEPDLDTLTVDRTGSSDLLTAHLGVLPEQFLLRYTGMLDIEEPGSYNFALDVAGGAGLLRIADQQVIPVDDTEGRAELNSGKIPFELLYARRGDWSTPNIELSVSAEGLREHVLSDQRFTGQSDRNPIYVHAREKPLLRSFMDLPEGDRLTHAVSVSSLEQLHYTYDLNHGSLVQAWRGEFLDVTPMWYSRGDGSSRPNGSVEYMLEEPALSVNKMEDEQAPWKRDRTGTGFKSGGYNLDDNDNPEFTYTVFGTTVNDRIQTVRDGGGLKRTIRMSGPLEQRYVRIGVGESIKQAGENRFLVDDQSYYIQLESPGGADNVIIREIDGHQELILPARPTIHYTILF